MKKAKTQLKDLTSTTAKNNKALKPIDAAAVCGGGLILSE